MPYSDVNLRNRVAHGPSWSPDSTTSEVSTVQLEFRDLSRLTKNPIFEVKISSNYLQWCNENLFSFNFPPKNKK